MSTTNLTWTGLESILGFRNERLATIRPELPTQSHARPGIECLLGLTARYRPDCGYQ
jgi:hypothetical protein